MRRTEQGAASSYIVNRPLFWSGIGVTLGALLHIAAIFGGPSWYAFVGAPEVIVRMARAGMLYPVLSCLAIAGLLLVCAAYAFSGAGLIRRLPGLRPVLAGIAAVLILRGVGFIPLTLIRPDALAAICNCKTVNAMLVATSLICLLIGIGYAIGAKTAGRLSDRPQDRA